MTQQQGSIAQPNTRARSSSVDREPSGWAIGFMFFASLLMFALGSFQFIAGLSAVLNDAFYEVRPGYDLKIDVSTWGWIHMIVGGAIVIAGICLFTGALWARVVAIALAALSLIWSFYSIPYYPVFAILLIAFNIGVIWSLTVHGRDLALEE